MLLFWSGIWWTQGSPGPWLRAARAQAKRCFASNSTIEFDGFRDRGAHTVYEIHKNNSRNGNRSDLALVSLYLDTGVPQIWIIKKSTRIRGIARRPLAIGRNTSGFFMSPGWGEHMPLRSRNCPLRSQERSAIKRQRWHRRALCERSQPENGSTIQIVWEKNDSIIVLCS